MIAQKYRAYLYRLATAAALLAVGYGLITDEKAALWLGLVQVAVGGLAAVNTPTGDASEAE